MHTSYNPEVVSSELRMKKEIYLAAATGNVEFLKDALVRDVEADVDVLSNDFLRLTSLNNNIIHIAAEHGHLEFIDEALKHFNNRTHELLICRPDNDGDTPLHMAAKLQTSAVAKHLVEVVRSSRPWTFQNKKGNSPLHVALMNGGKSITVAAYLLKEGPEVASSPNSRGESPLHLAVIYDNQGAKISMKNMMNTINGIGVSLDYAKSPFEEDSLLIIKELLENNPTVCCVLDQDGMTPLLRATINSYLEAVKVIIDYCPESIAICDRRGKTFLHHMKFPTFLDAREFLKIPGISTLMDQQDNDKNTPLHIAIMNCDYNMARAMIECNANLSLKNEEGTSPATLIQSNSKSFLDKMDYIRLSTNKDEGFSKELLEAAYNGKWQNLLERLKESENDKQFLSRRPDGTNMLHIAVQCCLVDYRATFEDYSDLADDENYSSQQEEFIVEASIKYPILICQTDSKGCTPLHYAMSYKILKPGGNAFNKMLDFLRNQQSCFPLPPWEAKDLHGDTLLHLAVRYRRIEMAQFLVEIADAKLVGETNNSNETPLHYLCRYSWSFLDQEIRTRMVNLLIKKDDPACPAVYTYDADGFTPLLRAVQNEYSIKIAERIVYYYPESIKRVDSHLGRNLLHLLAVLRTYADREFIKKIKPEMKSLLSQVDRQGNLPLHLALLDRRFETADSLIKQNIKLTAGQWFSMKNNDGKTPEGIFSTIEEEDAAPKWFTEFVSKNIKVEGVEKSLYDVPYSKMKDFMGPIGVVAALLVTITFTAAFTVPGGYEQNNEKINGSPIFAKRVAFQVFMFTDVIGMCSSVMSLICLIWLFTSSEDKVIGLLLLDELKKLNEAPTLGDLSMGFLQLSLYATLVAFMAGVYVTTLPEVQWLAVSTCVICCLVLLLMRKFFIIHFWMNVFLNIYKLDHRLWRIIGKAIRCFKRVCRISSAREDNSESSAREDNSE